MSVSEAARTPDVAPSTAHRLLATLRHQGSAVRDPTADTTVVRGS